MIINILPSKILYFSVFSKNTVCRILFEIRKIHYVVDRERKFLFPKVLYHYIFNIYYTVFRVLGKINAFLIVLFVILHITMVPKTIDLSIQDQICVFS